MAASRRRPAFPEASYYAELGRLVEHGCFDLMFFDDRLAMPGIYGDSVADADRYGARHEAEAHGTGAIALDGMLVDAAHMRHADTILFRAGLSVAS
jgi:alkanesulfonate monooxygenase SsuD/methylene tetrahydromethanopterin reductase-like flavin-dependent oxidoreductase (luciferase family)